MEALVGKLGLAVKKQPKPYPLEWIQKEASTSVTKQCTFKFEFDETYTDEVTYDVVLLDVCQVILGSRYLWDKDASLQRRE